MLEPTALRSSSQKPLDHNNLEFVGLWATSVWSHLKPHPLKTLDFGEKPGNSSGEICSFLLFLRVDAFLMSLHENLCFSEKKMLVFFCL